MKRETTETSFDTLAVRGREAEQHAYDAIATPIVCSATYTFASSAEIRDHFAGRIQREEYGRYGNPTVRAAEQRLALLEGAEDAVLFPSAMAAMTTFLLAMLRPGDHVLLTSDCYRRTRQFVVTILAKFGVTYTFVEPSDYAGLRAAVRADATRLLISEAPTNPYLRVADIARMAELKALFPRLKLLIDSTLATPFNCRPLALGADLVLHSGTKYLGGHHDLLSGALCGSAPFMDALRDARGLFGPMPDPHGAYLLMRGLKTLHVRMRQHNANGLAVARFLAEHPSVERVFYPGLESDPDHAVAKRQMAGFGGVLSFRLRADLEGTARFVDRVRIPRIGPSMGGVDSLIEQPALMSFSELTSEQRAAIGIADNLVRMSVGLEDAEDLVADLAQALALCGAPSS